MRSRIIVIGLIAILLAATIPIGSAPPPTASAQGTMPPWPGPQLPNIIDYDKDGDGFINLPEVTSALDDYHIKGIADKELAIVSASGYLLKQKVAAMESRLWRLRRLKLGMPTVPNAADLKSRADSIVLSLQQKTVAAEKAYVDRFQASNAAKIEVKDTSEACAVFVQKSSPEGQSLCKNPLPTITGLSTDHGQRGDVIAIYGQNFGNAMVLETDPWGGTRSICGVWFVQPPNRAYNACWIKCWTSTEILFEVPILSAGYNHYYDYPIDGSIVVETCVGESSAIAFRWEPKMELRVINPIIDYEIWWDANCAMTEDDIMKGPGDVLVVHHGDYILCAANAAAESFHGGCTDEDCGCDFKDYFLQNIRLINNWRVDSVYFNYEKAYGDPEAHVVGLHIGTDLPSFYVKWSTMPCDQLYYTVQLRIVGPEGTQPWEWK